MENEMKAARRIRPRKEPGDPRYTEQRVRIDYRCRSHPDGLLLRVRLSTAVVDPDPSPEYERSIKADVTPYRSHDGQALGLDSRCRGDDGKGCTTHLKVRHATIAAELGQLRNEQLRVKGNGARHTHTIWV